MLMLTIGYCSSLYCTELECRLLELECQSAVLDCDRCVWACLGKSLISLQRAVAAAAHSQLEQCLPALQYSGILLFSLERHSFLTVVFPQFVFDFDTPVNTLFWKIKFLCFSTSESCGYFQLGFTRVHKRVFEYLPLTASNKLYQVLVGVVPSCIWK